MEACSHTSSPLECLDNLQPGHITHSRTCHELVSKREREREREREKGKKSKKKKKEEKKKQNENEKSRLAMTMFDFNFQKTPVDLLLWA